MKQFLCGAVSSALLVVVLAASDSGFSVVWKIEQSRPSFQRAVADYVSHNCQLYLGSYARKQMLQDLQATDERGLWLPPINCQYDMVKADQGQ